jgi:hypothetical protein
MQVGYLVEPRNEIDANLQGTMSPKEHGECFVLKGNLLYSI